MRKYCILAVFCCLSYLAAAQSPIEKGLESINRTSAEAYIGFLAHDELQGREAGYHGSNVAAQYIASLFRQWEYNHWETAIFNLLKHTEENARKGEDWKYTPIQ